MGEYLSFDPDATVADMSIADLFLEDLMFFWRALTLDEWTGLTDEQEKTVAIVYLSMKASVTETAPEIYAKLAIVSNVSVNLFCSVKTQNCSELAPSLFQYSIIL